MMGDGEMINGMATESIYFQMEQSMREGGRIARNKDMAGRPGLMEKSMMEAGWMISGMAILGIPIQMDILMMKSGIMARGKVITESYSRRQSRRIEKITYITN